MTNVEPTRNATGMHALKEVLTVRRELTLTSSVDTGEGSYELDDSAGGKVSQPRAHSNPARRHRSVQLLQQRRLGPQEVNDLTQLRADDFPFQLAVNNTQSELDGIEGHSTAQHSRKTATSVPSAQLRSFSLLRFARRVPKAMSAENSSKSPSPNDINVQELAESRPHKHSLKSETTSANVYRKLGQVLIEPPNNTVVNEVMRAKLWLPENTEKKVKKVSVSELKEKPPKAELLAVFSGSAHRSERSGPSTRLSSHGTVLVDDYSRCELPLVNVANYGPWFLRKHYLESCAAAQLLAHGRVLPTTTYRDSGTSLRRRYVDQVHVRGKPDFSVVSHSSLLHSREFSAEPRVLLCTPVSPSHTWVNDDALDRRHTYKSKEFSESLHTGKHVGNN